MSFFNPSITDATPKQLVAEFLASKSTENTRKSYRNDLQTFFGPLDRMIFGDIERPGYNDINAYVTRLEREGIKPSTIRRRVSVLSSFYRFLFATKRVKYNPASPDVVRKVKKTTNSDRKHLSSEDAKRLVDAARHGPCALRDQAFVLVALYAGARRAELGNMRVDHFVKRGNHWVLRFPTAKGGADEWVKIPKRVIDAVMDYRRTWGIDEGYLWRKMDIQRGHPENMRERYLFDLANRIARKAGLGKIGLHTLRHTACMLRVEKKVPIHLIQQHMRHKRIDTTMHYVHQYDVLNNPAAGAINL